MYFLTDRPGHRLTESHQLSWLDLDSDGMCEYPSLWSKDDVAGILERGKPSKEEGKRFRVQYKKFVDPTLESVGRNYHLSLDCRSSLSDPQKAPQINHSQLNTIIILSCSTPVCPRDYARGQYKRAVKAYQRYVTMLIFH